jgi:myxalamid-type polyketide synthase MxaB
MNQMLDPEIQDSDIAIIGMACRFPGARDIDTFWQNLCKGAETIAFFADNEIAKNDRASLKQPNYVKAGSILSGIEDFDAAFFGYSTKEAETMDPQHRVFLECAWEALESAGYNSDSYQGAVGIYAGSGPNTYLFNNVFPNRQLANRRSFFEPMNDLHLTLGNEKDFLPTRVSYKLNLKGPSFNVQTACSTSLVAVHLACQALISGECDIALAGSVSIRVPQQVGYLYQEGMIFSPDGHCRTFDAKAQGTVFGNGAGVVVLKPLNEAIADGDNIYAVIKGSAINNDGADKIGYTAPSVEGQATVISEALAAANIEAQTISFIEAHGTGTSMGDPIEIEALSQVFREETSKKGFCAVGTVKTNVGHLMMAAGIAGLIKAVLSLKYKQIPPSLHFEEPNPQIDFANSPFYVNTKLSDWETNGIPRRAGVSSFGMGGTNAHIVLEEAPEIVPEIVDVDRDFHLLTLSAKSQPALHALAQRYDDYLNAHPKVSLANLCFTANVGRKHFNHRLALVGQSAKQIREQLNNVVALENNDHKTGTKQIAFLFTGQGSQYENMGFQLYETQPTFRKVIEQCDEILRSYLETPLLEVLYIGDKSPTTKGNLLLNQTAYTQPALFALEYALAELWKSWGIEPDIVMGHSVGEYVAACVAGVFNLEDGLKLIAERARLMQALPQNGEMVVVMAGEALVKDAIKPYTQQVSIAAINGPENVVISGEQQAVRSILASLRGIKTKTLPVSHAFHSPLMAAMLADFERQAQKVAFSPPQIKLISNVTGKLIGDEIATPTYWCQHVCSPVKFANSMAALNQQKLEVLIEIGPTPTLLGMGRQCLPEHDGLWLPSLRSGQADWQQLLSSLGQLYTAGVRVDWEGFDQDYTRQRVELPTYPFQRQRHWLDVSDSPSQYSLNRQDERENHPLLGQRLYLAGSEDLYFESHINPNWEHFAYLADHKVAEMVLMPLTAYLEMAWAAGMVAFKSDNFAVENVFVHQPLILPKDEIKSLQLILKTKNANVYLFEIFSRADVNTYADPTWTRLVSGQVRITNDVSDFPFINNNKVDFGELQTRCTEQISPTDFYSAYYMDYGPTFQLVQQLWKNDDEVLGQLQVPPLLLDNYYLHPAVLDAAGHILGELLPRDSYLPMVIEQLRIYRRPNSILWSYGKIRREPSGSLDTIAGDVWLFDEQGNLIATMLGTTVKRADLTQTETLKDCLYKETWQAKAVALGKNTQGKWLIFADQLGIGTEVADILSQSGHSPVLVSHGAAYEQVSQNHYRLNPREPGDFQRLMETLQKEQVVYQGIVHLWSLDELSSDDELSNLLSCGSILHLVQALSQTNLSSHLWLVTQGAQPVGGSTRLQIQQAPVWGLSQVINLEYPEFHCTSLDLEQITPAQHLVTELLSPDRETRIAYRHGVRHVARLQPFSDNDQMFQVRMDNYGLIENLQLKPMTRCQPGPNKVEIQVRAAGLNFRDILNVLGMLETYYAEQLGIHNASEVPLGFECAGTIVAVGEGITDYKVGDDVIALADGSLASFVTVPVENLAHKPEKLSFEEAATIPVAFSTAYYALHHLANIGATDRVLIHAAAGGVGQAAVQLAQHAGAEIFGTASQSKWDYLKSTGVSHVMNSRTLEFAEEIKHLTNEQGVDIVLNSLNGDFIEKSFDIIAKNGRFVELGKVDIWDDQQVQAHRPDVSYFPFDFREEYSVDPVLVPTILDKLIIAFNEGSLKPLPHTIFPVQDVVEAFRFMQQAKHVGKIVLSMPEVISNKSEIRQDGSYLITGGLGGLGLKVANWLIDQGAQHLVLTGRQGATSPVAQTAVQEMKQRGAEVLVVKADVSKREDVARLLEKCPNSLRGIFHAAGILDDGILEQQSFAKFERVMAPKATGAWYLHNLSQHYPLDFFVCFSSTTALLGTPGQGNYAAANAFLDALVHHRRALGLPGLSIYGGGWAEVGMAARLSERVRQRFISQGMNFIVPEQGLQMLGKLMSQNVTQAVVMSLDWSKWLRQFPKIAPFYENFAGAQVSEKTLDTSLDFRGKIEAAPPNKRRSLLQAQIQELVNKVLGKGSSGKPLGLQQGFFEYGMDSLTSIELRNYLQTSLDCSLSSTLVFNYSTIEALVDYLATEVLALDLSDVETPQAEKDEVLATEVKQLSEEDAEALLIEELEKF